MLIIGYIGANGSPNYNSSAVVELAGDHPLRGWGDVGNGAITPPADASVIVPMAIGNDITGGTNGLGSSVFDCRPYNIAGLYYSKSPHGNYRWLGKQFLGALGGHDSTVFTSYSPHLAVFNGIGLQ